jgi:hypothetical protein
MRRWLVLVMVLLMPLRALAGDFMGVQMALGGGLPSASAGAMPADCPMLAQAHAAAHPDAGAVLSSGGAPGCTSCDLCLPIAEWPAATLEVATFAGHEQPLMGGVAFESVAPAPSLKPPIS